MNTQIYATNRKKVLGAIYDYLLDTNEGKRAGILIEEAIGMRRKFLLSSSRITRSEERASGVKKILANPEDLEPVK